jgi:DNA-binding transcriptional regulator YhcF (GntR family)
MVRTGRTEGLFPGFFLVSGYRPVEMRVGVFKELFLCYDTYNKRRRLRMYIEIDFNSEEAIYVQLTNQIIMGIATSRLHEGDPLPSVRQLAETIGINMHTVNKAYSLLRAEGFVTIDRRKGAIISVDADKMKALEEMKQHLMVALARGCCRRVTRDEVHALIDEIYDEYAIEH